MRRAIDATVIKDRKILLVRKRKVWILPGGKPHPGESDLECLRREIGEELSGTEIENPRYYNEFEGKTPHTGDILKAIVYFASIKGELHPPAAEISAAEWIAGNETGEYNLSDITQKIVESLKKDGHL